MDKLISLQTIISTQANSQSEEIYNLMQQAINQNKSFIQFTTSPNHKIHPLIIHVLTSKGYTIEDITYKLPDGTTTFNYTTTATYKISIT